MEEMKTVIAAGGIVWKNDKVLLVRITYGSNKGMWMLPGGLVEPGESVEAGAIREIFEEAGIKSAIVDIAAIRTGVRQFEGYDQTNIYITFNMKYVDGEATPDQVETSEAVFFSLEEIKSMDNIVGLSKQIILNSDNRHSLSEVDINFKINNSYKDYNLYQ